MLGRKFGREVANYFSGSPLNRVGFLRGDHVFLSQALRHPSTRFLVCNQLQPLVQPDTPPAAGKLQFVSYDDVKPIIGEDPYTTPEEDQIKSFNSAKYVPQMVFLGIDEKHPDGLEYQSKNKYKGAPYFAIDVTPKLSVKDAAEQLIERLKAKGMDFGKGRVMDVEASDGKRCHNWKAISCSKLIQEQPPYMPKLGKCWTGTLGIHSVLVAANALCRSMEASSALVRLPMPKVRSSHYSIS